MGSTPIYAIPYVEPGDHPNVYPAADQAQAEAVEAALATYPTPRTLRRKSVTQTLAAASTYYPITFETDEGDGTGIAYANGIFTVPRAGVYQINANALFGGSATQIRLRITAGGGSICEVVGDRTGSALVACKAGHLAAGGTITVDAYTNTAGTTITASSVKYTTVDITLIAP